MPASLDSFKTSLENLIRRFDSDRAYYLSNAYSEAQARVDFITPFFKALGWDVENEEGLAHHSREVVVEAAEDTRGRPDYGFRVSGQTRFFVEAKAPSEELDTAKHIIQAKTYAWNTKQVFMVVLTDFEEFRFYDASIQPDLRRPDEGLLLTLKYTAYLKNAEKLWEFSKERVLAGPSRPCSPATAASFTSKIRASAFPTAPPSNFATSSTSPLRNNAASFGRLCRPALRLHSARLTYLDFPALTCGDGLLHKASQKPPCLFRVSMVTRWFYYPTM